MKIKAGLSAIALALFATCAWCEPALKSPVVVNVTDVDLVLGGLDILSAGIEQGLWTTILPQHAAKFPNVLENYLPPARKMQELAKSQALAAVFMPAGPLVEYNPDKVKTPPTTPQQLLPGAGPIRTNSFTPGQPIPGQAAPFSWGCPISSETRTRKTR